MFYYPNHPIHHPNYLYHLEASVSNPRSCVLPLIIQLEQPFYHNNWHEQQMYENAIFKQKLWRAFFHDALIFL